MPSPDNLNGDVKTDYDENFLNSLFQNDLILDISLSKEGAWDRFGEYIANIKKDTLNAPCDDEYNFFDRVDEFYQRLHIFNDDLYKIEEKLIKADHDIPDSFVYKVSNAREEDATDEQERKESLKRKREDEVQYGKVPDDVKFTKYAKKSDGYSSNPNIIQRSISFP